MARSKAKEAVHSEPDKAVENQTEITGQAENIAEENQTERAVQNENPVEEKHQKYTPKALDPHQLVPVANGFQGRLAYTSSRTGERFVWSAFGDVQDMELSELRSAKVSNKAFFVNNWFMIDREVADYLGVSQYYKYAVPVDKFDELFEKPDDEMERTISRLSNGQKKSVAYRAKQLIGEGVIDSNRKILTLERCLEMPLIER